MNIRDKKICVIGGDMRQAYLACELKNDGFSVSAFAVPDIYQPAERILSDALCGADAVILPFPLSPDCFCLSSPCFEPLRLTELFGEIKKCGTPTVFGGAVSLCVSEKANEYGIDITDYGKMESVAIKNALITAEGAIGIAIRETAFTLHSSIVTVFGYGRIGKQLCRLLKSLGACVRCIARKPEDIALMETEGIISYRYGNANDSVKDSDLIFNTVPAPVIGKEVLSCVRKGTLIIDLASSPGGVDREIAEKLGVRVLCALSLPGKTAPLSSARIIKNAIICELEKQ